MNLEVRLPSSAPSLPLPIFDHELLAATLNDELLPALPAERADVFDGERDGVALITLPEDANVAVFNFSPCHIQK